MKNFLWLPALLLYGIISAQNHSTLVYSNIDETTIDFHFDSYQFQTVLTPSGNALILTGDNMSAIMEKGSPDIPKYTESVIIPDDGSMELEVLNEEFTELHNIEIAPSKGNILRTEDPAGIPYEYGRVYNRNKFYPGKLASTGSPYILRDYRGEALYIYPFQYNPVTKTLRFYSHIRVKIFKSDEHGQNPYTRNRSNQILVKEYDNIYQNHFINYQTALNRYTPLEEEGNMLVICYDDWTSAMESFVNWKNTIGRPCEMVTVSEAGGTAEAIKNYVTNYYNTHGLTYLLLVGDAAQVPTNNYSGLGGDSDNAYGFITGDDHYSEFFVGRFSAESVEDVQTQVQRTLEYEMGDQLGNNWLNRLISVGSDQGPGDDEEMDFEHLRNIQTDLLGFTYVSPPNEFFDGSQGGEDAGGNPSPAQVAAAINAGAGIINYCGHGSQTSWGTSGFSNGDVNNLTNDNQLPFIWSVACVNGDFVGQTCFAESWVRATHSGEPTGAVAVLASTINQSWAPPMIGQDEMNDLLTGVSANGTKRTFGGLSINGCFQMIEESSDFAMIDTWTCFGDPSLYVRTDNPVAMNINHPDVLISSAGTFNVNCDTEGALATLSLNGEIVGSATVSGGTAQIPVSGLTPGTQLTLAVIGFNKITYMDTVQVIAPEGAYLIVHSYTNQVDFGQHINLDISLENVGNEDAGNVQVTASTSDANSYFTNSTYDYGTISAGSTSAPSSNAFTLFVADFLEDQYTIPVTLNIQSDNGSWESTVNVTVNAPTLEIGNLSIDDTASGNGDYILDAGETADLNIQVSNTGHADVTNVISQLSTTFSDITLNNSTTDPVVLNAGETQTFTFNVSVASGVPDGTAVSLINHVTAGESNQYAANKDFEIIVGFVPEYCEAGSDTTSDEFIQEVIFNDIDNTSTQGPAYSDYTNISTDINIGESYDITIINGEHWNGDQMGCWVDWNYDGDFDDEDEYIGISYEANTPSSGLGTGTGTVNVPAFAHLGATRMRVRVLYTSDILPCGDTDYGEVEDYTVNVMPSLSTTSFDAGNITLFPNPSDGYFTIQMANENPDHNALLEIFNLAGKRVYQTETTGNTMEIHTPLSEGIYIVRLSNADRTYYKKLIIK